MCPIYRRPDTFHIEMNINKQLSYLKINSNQYKLNLSERYQWVVVLGL